MHDIKETASDAVEIMPQIGTLGVQESLDKVRQTATIAKEIIHSLSLIGTQPASVNAGMVISEAVTSGLIILELTLVLVIAGMGLLIFGGIRLVRQVKRPPALVLISISSLIFPFQMRVVNHYTN